MDPEGAPPSGLTIALGRIGTAGKPDRLENGSPPQKGEEFDPPFCRQHFHRGSGPKAGHSRRKRGIEGVRFPPPPPSHLGVVKLAKAPASEAGDFAGSSPASETNCRRSSAWTRAAVYEAACRRFKSCRLHQPMQKGTCTVCGAKTKAHDPYWLRRCPACWQRLDKKGF